MLKHLTKTLWIILLSMVFFTAKGQLSFTCELRNDYQEDDKNIVFDVYMLSTGTTPIEYNNMQIGVTFNSAIKNGGTLSATVVSGFSDLSAAQQWLPANVSIVTTGTGGLKVTVRTPTVGAGNGYMISSTAPGTRLGRFRITNSVAFGQAPANFAWSFATNPWPTKTFAYVGGANTNITANGTYGPGGTYITTSLTNPVLNLPVTAYTIGTSGSYCAGSAGLPITLSSSELGVAYQLIKDAVNSGSPVAGTGAALNFGNQTAGVYTCSAQRSATYLTATMTGSATLTEDPATLGGIVTGGSTINSGQTSGLLTLAGHVGSVVKWQYSINDGTDWTDIANTNTTYTSGPLTQTTWFRAVVQSGSCASANSVHTVVTVTTAPFVYNVSGSGSYCQGGTGLTVTLSGSEIGVDYQLYKDLVASGAPIPGTGASITWPNQTAGSYTIIGTNSGMVTSNMNGTAVITETPNVAVSVSIAESANNVCAGTSVTFTATPTNGGLTPTYAWYVNSTLMTSGSPATYTYVPVNGDQIYVVLTSSETCTTGSPATSSTITMVVNPLLPVSVTVAADVNPVCAGTSVTFTATPTNGGLAPTYQWYVNANPVGTGLATYSYVPTHGDQVYVELTSSETCKSGSPATSNIVDMVVNPILPVSVSIAASANPVCAGSNVTFTATPVNGGIPTYQWYVNNVAAGTGLATYTYAPLNGDDVKVEMTSSETCKSGSPATSNTITMVVNPLVAPSVSIVADVNPVCATVPVTYTATPTNGGSTPTYEWYVNTVLQAGSSATFSYVPVDNDVVNAVLIPSADACATVASVASNNITMTVMGSTPASVTIAPSANSVCPGTSVTVTATPVVVGTLSYKWYLNNVEVLGEILPTYTFTPVNGDQVYVKVTSDVGCSVPNPVSSAPLTMIVLPANLASVSIAASTNPSCGPETVTYTATPSNGGTPSYQWLVNNLPVGLNQNSYAYAPTNGDVVKVIMTSTEACVMGSPATSNEINMTVTVPVVLGVSIAPDAAAVCNGSSVTYTATPVNGGASPVYKWFKNSVAVGLNQPTYTFVPVNGDQVYVELTATECNTGMATSATSTMIVNPLPIPSIAGNANSCLGETGVVYTTEAGMSAYTWTISGGTITAGQGTNSITVTWDALGVNKVTVIYTNTNNCTAASATNYTVNVYDRPTPVVNGPVSAGVGTSQVYTTDAGMSNYVWTVSAGGTITLGQGTNSITVLWNTAGNQYVTVNYNNANNCPATSATQYNVNVFSYPGPAGTITGSSAVCVGATGVAYSVAPILNATGYVWTLPAGATIASGSNTNSITVDFSLVAVSGNITVYGTNTYGNGTVSPDFAVAVNALPVPTVTGNNNLCAGSNGIIYTTEAGMTAYNWTVSAGGTITAGAGTNAITVTWASAGAKTVSVNYTNGNNCTATSATVYNVTVNALPVPTIAGNNNLCAGSTGITYTTEGGMTGYNWTVSAGGTITAGASTNAITVTWATAGAQTVSVNYTNANNCTAATATVYNVTVNALPTPTITGNNNLCAGTTGVTYTTQAGMTGYTWTVSAGGTITAGATTNVITVTWNTAGAQTVSVNYTNANSCTAVSPTVYNVTVNALPTPTIAGPASVCVNSTNNVYTTQSGMTGYTWTVSAGGTITAGATTNTITVTWSTTGAKTVTVNYTNGSGCTAVAPASYAVTVNALPTPTITGLNAVCAATTGVTYTTQTGMTGYTWTISAGGTITAGAGTNAITVTWNTVGAQSVSVNYTNASGCTAATAVSYPVTVNARPTPTITGPATACAASTTNVYTTQAGMTGYTWTVSAGGTITAGSTTNAITVTWNTAGAQTVSVNYTNASGCNATTAASYAVTVNALPTPTIAGPASVCLLSTGNVYSTQAGMTGYTWTVSAGGTITAGAGTNAITVTWNTVGAKTITVNYTNANGCAATTPASYAVTVNAGASPTITGTTSLCVNSGFYNYTTEPGMTAYVWTVSAGGTITFGAGTNQIQVTWNTAGAQTVSVNYTPSTGCPAAAPTVLPITVNGTPGAAGTITGTPTVCGGANGISYSTTSIPNTLTYVWVLPAGATIASGAGTTNITVNFAGNASSGPITVYGNNLCGNGASSPAYNVTVNQLPAAAGTISGPATVCAGTSGVVYSVTNIANASSYVWSVPSGATIVSGGNTNSITVNFASSASSGSFSVYGTNSCGNGTPSPAYVVTVNPIPPTPVITFVNDVLSSSIATGNQWYQDGVAIAGATNQTYEPTSAGDYYVIVTLNGCSSGESNHIWVSLTGISDAEESNFTVYPVPNNGRFTVSVAHAQAGTYTIRVVNALGQSIFEQVQETDGTFKKDVDLNYAPNGMYQVAIINNKHTVIRKILITK